MSGEAGDLKPLSWHLVSRARCQAPAEPASRSVSCNPRAVGAAAGRQGRRERTRQWRAASQRQVPTLRNASRGAAPSAGLLGAPAGKPGGGEGAGGGWVWRGLRSISGVLLGVASTRQPPPLLVSSLTRRQQVLEGPRPQSPCGHCGPEAGPHHPCPLHTHCSGHRGPQHSTAHRWVPGHSASRHPARSVLSPRLCLCAALGAGGSAPGRTGAWLLVQRTRGLHSHQSARPRGPQAVWTHLSLGPSQGSLLVLECSSSCPCKVLLRAPRPARPRGQGDPGGGGPWQ